MIRLTPDEFAQRLSQENSFMRNVVAGPRLWLMGDEDAFRRLAA